MSRVTRDRFIFVPGNVYAGAVEAILAKNAVFTLDENVIEMLLKSFPFTSLHMGRKKALLTSAAFIYAPKIRDTPLEEKLERAIEMIVETGLYEDDMKRTMERSLDGRQIRQVIAKYSTEERECHFSLIFSSIMQHGLLIVRYFF